MLQCWRVSLGVPSKQIHDRAFAGGSLVNRKGGAELAMGANLDSFEQFDGEVLAVVADEIVCWAFFAPGGKMLVWWSVRLQVHLLTYCESSCDLLRREPDH